MSGKRKAETDPASMDTDKIVQEALREVEERKKAKKQAQTGNQACCASCFTVTNLKKRNRVGDMPIYPPQAYR